MTSLEQTVANLVPHVYADAISRLEVTPFTDMSRSNRCDMLSLSLWQALHTQGVDARRELHTDHDGQELLWHYVVAHTALDAEPTEHDIITDLNPWQFVGEKRSTGYLHAERHVIQTILSDAGAPEWFVSLRGLNSIQLSHTIERNPFVQQ